MRLIDADEFKRQVAGMAIANNYPADKANKMCELIDCQPTAYDMDKVVERLKKEFEKYYGKQWDEAPYLVNSIEIVKSGGIE